MKVNKVEQKIDEIKNKFENFLDWQIREFKVGGWELDGYEIGSLDGYFHGILDNPEDTLEMDKDDYIYEYFDWRDDSLNELLFEKFLKESGIRLKKENWSVILGDYTLVWFDREGAEKARAEYEEYKEMKEKLEEEQYEMLEELGDLFENWMYNAITRSNFQISRSSSTSSFYVEAGNGRRLKVSDHPHATNNRNYDLPNEIFLYCPEDKLEFFERLLEGDDSIRESYNKRGYVEKSYKIFTSRNELIRAIIKFIRKNQ